MFYIISHCVKFRVLISILTPILAIISVITIPIILNVIDKAKQGAVIDSAYGYKETVNNFYIEKLSLDSNYKLRGWYTYKKLNQLGLTVNGTTPTDDSWVQIDNNTVIDYSLKFDDYVVSYDEQNNKNIVTKGNLKENPGQYFMNNIDYYIDTLTVKNNPVYYNPLTGNKCNVGDENENYVQNNSLVEFNGIIEGEHSTKTKSDQTSCLKWYKYSVNIDGTVNMILDHNTSIGLKWSETNNNQKAEIALKVMNGLLEDGTIGDTTLWSNKLIREDKYKATWKQSASGKELNTTIDYTGYKARLIAAQEIADITHASEPSPIGIGFNEHDSTRNDGFYLDGGNYIGTETESSQKWQTQVASEKYNSSYSWLFENLYGCCLYGCPRQQNKGGNWGYWTSSPVANSASSVWRVRYYGRLYPEAIDYTLYGVRPVITILSE